MPERPRKRSREPHQTPGPRLGPARDRTPRFRRDPTRVLLTLALFGSVSCGLFRSGYNPKIRRNETQRLEVFLDEAFQARLDRSPEQLSRLGLGRRSGEWDDLSERAAREDYELAVQDRKRLRSFRYQQLSAAAQLDYRLFEAQLEQELESYRWRLHEYPVNQMRGVHSSTPAFLINVHKIASAEDAQAYIARLEGIGPRFEVLIEALELREREGILPPAFVFPLVLADCRNLIEGRPFHEDAPDSPLFADFLGKLSALELDGETQVRLEREARRTLLQSVGPAYEALINVLERQAELADDRDGVWKLPNGGEFYTHALNRATTTEIEPERLHDLGLTEVARIHEEMRLICESLEYEGSLNEFFAFLRSDPRFFYPNTADGRADYLARATEIIDEMRGRLGELFGTLPEAPIVVRAVEPYREQSAGKAFYERGTADGSRPGVYYANLFDMGNMPKYQMEALAYHEGIPGHHMQLSIAAALEGVPRFRRHARYTAYSEGWALYTELIPKEMGLYEDPYSDFGRLAMELWRACRLVVDTGIHHLRWTRREAIDYLMENTPNPEGDCIKAIERYIVMPGQATAYKVGMLRIQALRGRAENVLGDDFDLRAFHDLILTVGPMPLDVLEDVVKDWISAQTP